MAPPLRNPGNLFAELPADRSRETFETLVEAEGLRLERIVSYGQATPRGEWLRQDADEWVVLLQGSAGLQLEGEPEPRVLQPGDYVLIPGRTRHRVEWTVADRATIWLALHHG
ncbi:MAG TPA: cupin domain-containing protein [bacterium]|nr:cupin domain-containing protein [bacterium]